MAHIKGDYNGEWFNLNTESSIATGTAMKLQNQGTYRVVLQESTTEPLQSDWSGEFMTTLLEEEPSKVITEGSGTVWVRSSVNSVVSIFVQEI
ncbi:hypothetical protein VPHF102_0031 [Vibrio phage F102]